MIFVRKSEFRKRIEELDRKLDEINRQLKHKADASELATVSTKLNDISGRVTNLEITLRDSNIQQMREEYNLFIRQMKMLNLKFLEEAVDEVKQKLEDMMPKIDTMKDYSVFKVRVEGELVKLNSEISELRKQLEELRNELKRG